jgi:hypothetical protein
MIGGLQPPLPPKRPSNTQHNAVIFIIPHLHASRNRGDAGSAAAITTSSRSMNLMFVRYGSRIY